MDQLSAFRKEIDHLDELMIEILAKRFRVTQKVGYLNKAIAPTLHSLTQNLVTNKCVGYRSFYWAA